MSAPTVFASARRYYLTKAFQAVEANDQGLRSAWVGKQAAEPGTALAATIPYQTEMAALVPSYTTAEDLDGATAEELVRVGLPRSQARAVIAALG